MKRLIFTLFTSLCIASYTFADSPFTVGRIDGWSKDALTVFSTLNHHYYTTDTKEHLLRTFDLIREINGQTTSGMSEEQFYAIIESSPEFRLTIERKEAAKNITMSATYRSVKGIEKVDKLSAKRGAEVCHEMLKGGASGIVSQTSSGEEMFRFNTFNFKNTAKELGSDSLYVKRVASYLEGFGLRQNRQSPDIWIALSKSRPNGGNGTFIELTLLDAKAKSQSAPVWRFTIDTQEELSQERVLELLTWIQLPAVGYMTVYYADIFSGMDFNAELSKKGKEVTYRVANVIEGSRADKIGFKTGDIIMTYNKDGGKSYQNPPFSKDIPHTNKYLKGFQDTWFKSYIFYFCTKYNGKYSILDWEDEYIRHLLTTSGRFNYKKVLYERGQSSTYKSFTSYIDTKYFQFELNAEADWEVERGNEKVTLRGQLYPLYYKKSLQPQQKIFSIIKL